VVGWSHPRRVVLALALALVCASAIAVLAAVLPALSGRRVPVAVPPKHQGVPVSEVTGNPGATAPQSPAPARARGSSTVTEGAAVSPARFQAGSCVLFAPTSGDRRLTAFLDAGHGGIDRGCGPDGSRPNGL
jgi:N-acetylmuramoyl-L-alanine amidase